MINGIWGFLSIFILDLDGSAFHLGILATLPGLASTFMQLSWGRISDRLEDNRPMVAIGFFLTSVLSLPIIISTHPWHVIAATGFQVLFGSIISIATVVMLSDLLEPKFRLNFMSIYNPLGFAGHILGSLGAGFMIPLIGYRPVFLSYMFFNLLIFIFITHFLTDKDDDALMFFSLFLTGIKELVGELKELPELIKKGGVYTRWVFGISIRGFGIAMFGPVLIVFLVRVLNASKPQIGSLDAISFAVRLATSSLFGFAAIHKRLGLGVKGLMLVGVVLASGYPLLSVLTSNVNQLVPVYIMSGIFWGCINTAWFAWQMNLIPKQHGIYTGLLNFVNGLAWALGPLLGGIFQYYFGFWISAIIPSIIILAGFFILLKVPENATSA